MTKNELVTVLEQMPDEGEICFMDDSGILMFVDGYSLQTEDHECWQTGRKCEKGTLILYGE